MSGQADIVAIALQRSPPRGFGRSQRDVIARVIGVCRSASAVSLLLRSGSPVWSVFSSTAEILQLEVLAPRQSPVAIKHLQELCGITGFEAERAFLHNCFLDHATGGTVGATHFAILAEALETPQPSLRDNEPLLAAIKEVSAELGIHKNRLRLMMMLAMTEKGRLPWCNTGLLSPPEDEEWWF